MYFLVALVSLALTSSSTDNVYFRISITLAHISPFTNHYSGKGFGQLIERVL